MRAVTIRADATDEDQIVRAVQETLRELGRIDILLNMASVYLSTPGPKETDWSNIIDANARITFLFSIHAGPIMKLFQRQGDRPCHAAGVWNRDIGRQACFQTRGVGVCCPRPKAIANERVWLDS